MNIIKILNSFTVLILLLASCNKNDSVASGTGKVYIDSLIPDDSVLNVWHPTRVKAYARGEGIEYTWEADHGEINGSGTEISYMAGDCCTGINTIICTVKNAESSDSKQLKIRILPYKK